MITNFILDANNNLITSEQLSNAIWTDLLAPTPQEQTAVEKELNIAIPEHNELLPLEFSNRFYEHNGALYMCVNVITTIKPVPETHRLIIIITPKKLITVRYSDPNPIQTIIAQLPRRPVTIRNPIDIFLIIAGGLVGQIADVYEFFEVRTEELSGILMQSTTRAVPRRVSNLNHALAEVTHLENLLSKCYQSLSSLQLMLSFFPIGYAKLCSETMPADLPSLTHDIKVMIDHGEYLTQKIEFQLETTLGLINLEQTYIIKTFTVLAMIFMPPTLIASIYGMNFKNIPELSLPYAYPLCLLLMLATSIIPYKIFKSKGWI